MRSTLNGGGLVGCDRGARARERRPEMRRVLALRVQTEGRPGQLTAHLLELGAKLVLSPKELNRLLGALLTGGTYETRACQKTADRQCDACRECTDTEYVVADCETGSGSQEAVNGERVP